MKKIIYILFIGLLLSGCNKQTDKTLVCNKNEKLNENDVFQKIESTYIDNKIAFANLDIKIVVSDRYVEYINVLEQQLLESYNEFRDKAGVTFSSIKGDSDIKVLIGVDFSKINAPIEALGLINDQSTYDDAYKTFTEMGYSCK